MWTVMGEKNSDIDKLSDNKSDEVVVADSTESQSKESPVVEGSSVVSKTEADSTSISTSTSTGESDESEEPRRESGAESAPTVVESNESDADVDLKVDEPAEPVVEKSEPIVEIVYLDDSKVGTKFEHYPLSGAVVRALAENGDQYLSRYQQLMLDNFTLGHDKWFSVNLASNRGTVIGAYLVDLARINLQQTSVVLCVAVPKIRHYFERDFLAIAKYTGVKILSVHETLEGPLSLSEVPNIVIASIEGLSQLKEHKLIDFTNVEVLYFDEVEKTIRDDESGFVNFISDTNAPQVLMQSSYFSDEVIASVHQCKPELHPTRIFKNHQKGPDVFVSSSSWDSQIQSIVSAALLQRLIVVTDDPNTANECLALLKTIGCDVCNGLQSDDAQLRRNFDDLRENRLQILLVNMEQFLSTNQIEFDVLVALESVPETRQGAIRNQYKRVSTIIVLESTDEVFAKIETASLEGWLNTTEPVTAIVSTLREGLLTSTQTDWSNMVDEILQTPDGKQLLGEALRVALQSKRSEQGYIRSSVYKMERKDIYQRRTQGRRRVRK
jgi:hypothetical protein